MPMFILDALDCPGKGQLREVEMKEPPCPEGAVLPYLRASCLHLCRSQNTPHPPACALEPTSKGSLLACMATTLGRAFCSQPGGCSCLLMRLLFAICSSHNSKNDLVLRGAVEMIEVLFIPFVTKSKL